MALFDTTGRTGSGIDDGSYVGTIVKCEVKDTRAGDGRYLNVQWKLDNGPSIFKMYTIANPNEKAVDIGLNQITDIQKANDIAPGPVESTEDLLGLRCLLTVKNKTDDYGTKPDITNHRKAPADSSDDLPI